MMVHPSTTINTTTPVSGPSRPRRLPDIGALAQEQQTREDRPKPKGPGVRRALPIPIPKNPAPPPTVPLPIPVPLADTVTAVSNSERPEPSSTRENATSKPAVPPIVIPTPPSSFTSSSSTGVTMPSPSSIRNRGIRTLPLVEGGSRRTSSITGPRTNATTKSAYTNVPKETPATTSVAPKSSLEPTGIAVATCEPIFTSVFTSSFATSAPSKRDSTASAFAANIMAELDFNVNFNLDLNLVTLPPIESTTTFNHLDSDTDSELESESDENSPANRIEATATILAETERPKTPPALAPLEILTVPNQSASPGPSSFAFNNTSTTFDSDPAESVAFPRRQSTSPSPSFSSISSVRPRRTSNGRLNGARAPPVSMSGRRTMTPNTLSSQGQFAHQQQQSVEGKLLQSTQQTLEQGHAVNQQPHPPVIRTRTTSEDTGTRPTGHGHGHSTSVSSLNAMSRMTSNSPSISPPVVGIAASRSTAHKVQHLQSVMSTATLTSTRRRSALPQTPPAKPGPIIAIANVQQAQAPVLLSVQPKPKPQERGSALQMLNASSAPTTTTTSIGFGVKGGRSSPAQGTTSALPGFPDVTPEPLPAPQFTASVKGKMRAVSPDPSLISTHSNARFEELVRSDDDASDIVPVRMIQRSSPPLVGAANLSKFKDTDKALPALPPSPTVHRKTSKWKAATVATSTLGSRAVSLASGLQNNISKKLTGNLKAVVGTRTKAVPSIQDMPSELWSQIFLWCLPQPGPQSFAASLEEPLYIEPRSTCMPLVLCQVNRMWRFTAISTPGLWSSLSLRLHGRANWMIYTQSWLERAANLPLSLHISWGPDKDLEAHDNVLEYLLFKANQWKHVRLSVSKEFAVWQAHGFPSRIRKLLSSKKMPILKSLEVATSLSTAVISTIEVQKVAPRLRNLRLIDIAIDPLKFVTASWEQLTGFQSAYVLEVPQALTILRRCPNMVQFDVCVGSSPLVEPTKTRKIIRPSQLKVLIIRETTPAAVDGFLRSLDLPGVEEVYIKAETWSKYEEYGWNTDELLHLLTRSNQGRLNTTLKKLSVFDFEWDEGDIDEFAREMTSITTIEVRGRLKGQVRVISY